MAGSQKFSMFSDEEKGFYMYLRKFREKIVRPAVVVLAKSNIKPDLLSYLGVVSAIVFVYFFSFNPWLAFIFLLIQVILDNLDGSLARYMGRDSDKGAFTDMVCDYLSFFIIFYTFIFYEFVNPFWGGIFALSYIVLQSFVSLAVLKKIKLFPIVRPKLFIYLLFLIWLITGYNFIDQFLIVAVFYLIITVFFIYRKISCSI